MKNLSYTKIAIWTIFAVVLKMYVWDLPCAYKKIIELTEISLEIDTLQFRELEKSIERDNRIVNFLKSKEELLQK